MHVLMTADTVGGVWTYTTELATGLLDAGCELTLVTLGGLPSREQQQWIDTTAFLRPRKFRARTTQFPLEWMQGNTHSYSEAAQLLLNCMRQYRPDILHSNQFCFGALPTSIPKVVVAHSDVLSWWRASRRGHPEDSPWIATYLRLVTEGLRGADSVVAPTRWMMQQIDCAYGPFRSGRVVPNGIQIENIPSGRRRLRAVTAGRLWDEAKNIAILSEVRSAIPLVVAGDESFDGAQSAWADDRVRRLGRLRHHDLLRLFCESAIYIITSRYEPFGLAAVEAALCGCAIVANDIPALREVWGDAALYFERNNANSLSRILDRLVGDETAVRQASRRARSRAREHFTRERMTAGYLDVYSRLLSRGEKRDAA